MFPLAVCLLTAFGVALVVDPSNPIAVLLAMVTNFQSHAYLMAVAVAVAFVVSLAKQGWLSFWLQSKLPSWALPILAAAVGVGATWSTEVQSGIPWSKALWDAFNAAAIAVFAHQMLVEHMRGGKELVPARKPPVPPAQNGGSPSGPRSVPPKAPVAQRLTWAGSHWMVAWSFAAVSVVILVIAVLCSGCFSTAPIVPVTPANTDQVSSCQGIGTAHNDVVVAGFVVGGASAGMAGVGAVVTDTGQKNGLAIGAAIAGALSIVGTAVAGYTGAEFANGNCSSVVGALPAGGK